MKVKRLRAAVYLLLTVLLLPGTALAAWTDFIPRPYENGAEVRLFASYEMDDNEINNDRRNWDDTFLREKFTLYSKGYAYHPRFIQYYFELTGGLKQEQYSSTFQSSNGYTGESAVEYNARLFLLPEHKYNLELFAKRFEPLFPQRSAIDYNTIQTSKGGLFRYRNKPLFLNARFIDEDIESVTNKTEIQTLSAGGSYFKDLGNSKVFSVSGTYNRPSFSTLTGLEGHSNEAYLSNLIRNRWLSLNSNLTRSTFDQENPFSGTLESEQLSILELLKAYLRYGFRTEAFYRYQDNENRIGRANGLEDTRTNTRREIQAALIHRLYESLDSRYTFRRDSSSSLGGGNLNVSHYLNFDYSNRTKIGMLLAGLRFGRNETESEGVTSIANESHTSTSVPGAFILNEPQLIEPDTIEVFLRSPIPPNELILLQENIHYVVIPEGSTFRIDVINLPREFVLPGEFDFFVTYSLTSGNFELQTDSYGYNVSYDLFYKLRPYHSYYRMSPQVIAGVFPGFEFDQNTIIAGLEYHHAGFRALGEYEHLDWEVSPFTAYRLETRYSGRLTSTLHANASAEYLNRHFPIGNALGRGIDYTEERLTLSASIQKQFFRRRLLLSTGGSYSTFDGLTQGDAYSWNSTLSWRIARLDFLLGAYLFHSDAMGIGTIEQDRRHQYYYLSVGRKFF